MALLGVDVSEFQSRPDWAAVKASGLAFAIARVSFGATHNDLAYSYNRTAIPRAGLVPGAYHFLTSAYPAAQADFFCANADPAALHCLDVEYAGLDVPAWIARYRTHYPRKPLLIYTGRDLWSRAVGGLNGGQYGGLWLAGYRPNAYSLAMQVRAAQDAGQVEDWHAEVELDHAVPGRYSVAGAYEPLTAKWAAAQAGGISGYQFGGWSSWAFCQFSDRCTVRGISGGVDGDAFSGTLAQLQSLASAAAPLPATGRPVDIGVNVSGTFIGVGVHEQQTGARVLGDVELAILRGVAPSQTWQTVWRGPLVASAVKVDLQGLVPHAGDWHVRAAFHPALQTWAPASAPEVVVTTH